METGKKNDNEDNEEKEDNFQVVEMNSSKSPESQEEEEAHPQPEEKNTKDDITSVIQSISENKPEETAKPEPPKKKRRKQILDKELRMRYGIWFFYLSIVLIYHYHFLQWEKQCSKEARYFATSN